MKRIPLFLLPAIVLPLVAQPLSERFRDGSRGWDQALEKGDASLVRKATEGLLAKEALAVSRTDYNEMRVLVAVRDYAARACALEGNWEDTVAHLQQASSTAAENLAAAESTFSRIRREHETKLVEWREAIQKQEENLKAMESKPGLSDAQIKYRGQVRAFLDEHRAAIAHSEWSMKEMDNLLAQLKKERDTYQASLASWQAFSAKEKQEIAQAGGISAYVSAKLEQVKADEGRPRFDRLSYARRLQKLDADNREVLRFINSMVGIADDKAEPKTSKRKKSRKK